MDDDRDAPVTRADFDELRAELKDDVAVVSTQIQNLFKEMKEVILSTQVEVLKSFDGFIESTQLKLADSLATEANLRERLAVLERRLTEIEKRVSFPTLPQ